MWADNLNLTQTESTFHTKVCTIPWDPLINTFSLKSFSLLVPLLFATSWPFFPGSTLGSACQHVTAQQHTALTVALTGLFLDTHQQGEGKLKDVPQGRWLQHSCTWRSNSRGLWLTSVAELRQNQRRHSQYSTSFVSFPLQSRRLKTKMLEVILKGQYWETPTAVLYHSILRYL